MLCDVMTNGGKSSSPKVPIFLSICVLSGLSLSKGFRFGRLEGGSVLCCFVLCSRSVMWKIDPGDSVLDMLRFGRLF